MARTTGGERGSELSGELLRGALDELRVRISEKEHRLNELQASLKVDRAEETLLESLFSLKTGGNGEAAAPQPSLRGRSAPHQVVESTVAVLQEAGRPMHVSELMRSLQEGDVHIPGSGTQANLISHIIRDDRIVRPSRGMYALTEWGQTTARPQSKKNRRRVSSRTRVSTAKSGGSA